jgi:hypothetical protein
VINWLLFFTNLNDGMIDMSRVRTLFAKTTALANRAMGRSFSNEADKIALSSHHYSLSSHDDVYVTKCTEMTKIEVRDKRLVKMEHSFFCQTKVQDHKSTAEQEAAHKAAVDKHHWSGPRHD